MNALALAGLAQRLGLRVAVGCRALVRLPQCEAAAARQERRYSSGKLDEFSDELESINELFVEARDEIDYAKEDAESVYFNESYQAASKAVDDVLGAYQGLLGRLSEEERAKLQRAMGLKMEQLKAELAELDTLHE